MINTIITIAAVCYLVRYEYILTKLERKNKKFEDEILQLKAKLTTKQDIANNAAAFSLPLDGYFSNLITFR